MDEFNNNDKNPFDEQDTGSTDTSGTYDPYNQPRQPANPYSQPQQPANPYNQPQQNSNPYYGQSAQGTNPYNQSYQQQGTYNQYNQQNIPQQGYVPPQYGTPYQPYPQNQSAGMAVASMVLGIISIAFSLFMLAFPVLFLIPIIGIVLGIVFKSKRLQIGKGMSTAGIITSVIGLLLPILLVIIAAVLIVTNGHEVMEFLKTYSPEEYNELYEMYGDQFPQWFDSMLHFLR